MAGEVQKFAATATVPNGFGPADLLFVDHDETTAQAADWGDWV